MNIQDNKLDHVLEDIDKLYPDDGNLDELQKESRFILQLNYYIKSKDDEGEKKFLEKTVEDKEWLGYIELVYCTDGVRKISPLQGDGNQGQFYCLPNPLR